MEADATFDGLRIDATVTCSRFAPRALLPDALRPSRAGRWTACCRYAPT